MNRQHIGDSIMRAAIVLAGTLLFFSSALFADSTGGVASKPILVAVANVSSSQAAGTVEMKAGRVASAENQVLEGRLEEFGARGLSELLVVATVSTGGVARKAWSVT